MAVGCANPNCTPDPLNPAIDVLHAIWQQTKDAVILGRNDGLQLPTGVTEAVAEPAARQHTIALLLPTLNELQGLKAILPCSTIRWSTMSSSSMAARATARWNSPWTQASPWLASCAPAFTSQFSTSGALCRTTSSSNQP